MDRLRRLTSMWSWLPAFRAVAETENFHEASRRLRVTASALSRAVRLLEADIGVRLFERTGRNVRLTRHGHAMLASVRDGMRVIDDGLAAMSDAPVAGPTFIVCQGEPLASSLSRILARLYTVHALIGHIHTQVPPGVGSKLLRGDLDVAFVTTPPSGAGLHVELVGTVHHAVFCGRAHPLFGRTDITLSELLAYPFVALTSDATNGESSARSPWPPELSRQVALFAPSLRDVRDVCERGELLAVLPTRVRRDARRTDSLFALHQPSLALQKIYAVTRTAIGDGSRRAALVVEALREELAGHADDEPRAQRRKSRA